jgi:nicotinamidase-related amidase
MNTTHTTHFLHAEQCCLFIVDPQERLMAQIHQAEQVIQRIQLMLHLAKVLDLPVLSCTQYAKGIGPIVPEIAALLGEAPCVDKTQFNALAHPEVQEMLQRLPQTVDTLLLCGVESHICIYQTAKAALQANYQVQVVADGISSRKPEHDAYGKQRLRDMGAILAPAEMIIYELLHKAGTPAFKAMLPHVK